jgi:hypothetical protein
VAPHPTPQGALGDFTLSTRPVEDWVEWGVENYKRRYQFHEALTDHSVPFVNLNTHTGIFAAAFGCELHQPAEGPPFALPCVSSAAEAEALPEPDLEVPIVQRLFGFARLMQQELGDVYFGAPDLQSPFDIASLIWRKEDFLMALIETPEAVQQLIQKCARFLIRFLDAFRAEFPKCKLMHMNAAWAPPDVGCAVSEDEVGVISTDMFQTFCLPGLQRLSEHFNGLFIHCCANAEHQHENFLKIPKLRGINRVMPEDRDFKWIEDFSEHTVILAYYHPVERMMTLLEKANENTRFLFVIPANSVDDARQIEGKMLQAFSGSH